MSEPISSGNVKLHRDNGTLRALGFGAGTTAMQSSPGFTIEDIKAALFNTKYSDPKTLPVKLPSGHIVQVAISKVEPRHSIHLAKPEADDSHEPVTFYEYPDWYIEGWIVDGIATASAQGLRVRMFVYSCGDTSPEPDDMYAQIIPTYSVEEGDIYYVDDSEH